MANYGNYSDVINATTWETETGVLLARAFTAPSAALTTLINTTTKGFKDDGTLSKADGVYVFGLHESQLSLQNWRKNAHNGILSATPPIHTVKEGFTGGANKYIDINYKLKSQSVNYGRTDCSVIIMLKTIPTTNATYLFGVYDGTYRTYLTFYTSANERFYFNSSGYEGTQNFANETYYGYTRNGDNVIPYIDGVGGSSLSRAAEADLCDITMTLLALNSSGTIGNNSNGLISFLWIGKGLSEAEHLSIVNRMKYFYSNVGGTF